MREYGQVRWSWKERRSMKVDNAIVQPCSFLSRSKIRGVGMRQRNAHFTTVLCQNPSVSITLARHIMIMPTGRMFVRVTTKSAGNIPVQLSDPACCLQRTLRMLAWHPYPCPCSGRSCPRATYTALRSLRHLHAMGAYLFGRVLV